MATKLLPALVPVLTAGLALPLEAQLLAPVVPISQGQGMWTADAVGVQWRDAAQTTRLGVRDAGVVGAQTATWSEARFGAPSIDHPDYSPEALFAHWVPALFGQTAAQWGATHTWHNPLLGGWSTGGDITPAVNLQGVLQLAPPATPAWYNLSFSVDESAAGVEGSAVAQAIQATGRASDHIFSYTAFGSSLIRADHVHTVRTESTGAQLGLAGAAPRLTALDWGMGLISETPGGSPSRLQPVRNRLYFSLSADWLSNYQPGPLPSGIVLRSNEIYGMEWDGGNWSVPTVAFSELDLFGSSQPGAELDALSVYSASGALGQEATAVFSLTPSSVLISGGTSSVPDQILVTQRGAFHPEASADVFAAPLSVATDSTVAPVSSVVGLEKGLLAGSVPDNVTGLCGRDPSEGQTLDVHKATPTDGAELGHGIELSALRHFDVTVGDDATSPGVVDTLRLTVSGIDEAGFDLAFVEFHLVSMHEVNGTLEPKGGFPVLTAFGGAQDGLIEGVYPYSLPAGFAQELRAVAVVHGIQLAPFNVVTNIAYSGSVTLGLD